MAGLLNIGGNEHSERGDAQGDITTETDQKIDYDQDIDMKVGDEEMITLDPVETEGALSLPSSDSTTQKLNQFQEPDINGSKVNLYIIGGALAIMGFLKMRTK